MKDSRKSEILAAATLVCLYLALANGHLHSIDGLLMYRQAEALVYAHSLFFPSPVVWSGTAFATSKYPIGLSLAYIPGLEMLPNALPYLTRSQSPVNPWFQFYGDSSWIVAGIPVHVLSTAFSAYLVARFLRLVGFDRRTSLWGLALYGIGSPAIVYTREDFGQTLEGLCLIAALYGVTAYRETRRPRDLVGCSVAVGYAVLTRPVEGSLLLPAVLMILVSDARPWRWTRADWSEIGVVLASYVLAIAVTVFISWQRFGSPFATGYGSESWTTPLLEGLAGTLGSPGRGILWEFPAVFLVPIGARYLWQAGHRRVVVAVSSLCILLLLNNAMWDVWWGGVDWGLRLFVPALPLLAILSAPGTQLRRRWLPGALLAGGIIWALPALVTDYHGGYSAISSPGIANWKLETYPPVGAWLFLRRVFALSPLDPSGVDIVWFREALATGYVSLVPMIVLLIIAILLALWLARVMRPAK